jgi:SAM-dependent methyltransferase
MEDIFASFSDLESWSEFRHRNQRLFDRTFVQTIVDHALAHGVVSSFLGRLGPEQIEVVGPNFRETLLAAGLNPRQRAILELLTQEAFYAASSDARIYAAEALTPFALHMRGRFPRFIGSEYVEGEEARQALYPIEFQDLTQLTLRSDAFDCVITNDCLEHVPDISRCLDEMYRVLRADGVLLSTFPFSFRHENIVKARVVGGKVEFLAEPEYHGNPAEPEKGSLVFEIPGWQILETARQSGFARSEMVLVSSVERGITATDIGGVIVMRCYK